MGFLSDDPAFPPDVTAIGYLGFAFARAGSAEEVEATLRQVREQVEIIIEP